MMPNMPSKFLITFLTAICAIPALAVAETRLQLRVLETTDIHVHIADYDYFQDRPTPAVGLARTATLIAQARKEVHNSVLVDNGDLLQGNPLGDYIARQRGLESGDTHVAYKAMNLLGYTVGNVGNHEFNYGLAFLDRSIGGANFPYISANVFHDDGDNNPDNDQPYFKQYIIVERELIADDGSKHAIRIGFVGFVPPQIMSWDLTNLRDRVVAHDIVATARQVVPKMKREGADIVIAIPHSGITTSDPNGMDENATFYLSKIAGIDAIMFGHSHRVFPSEDYAGIDGIDIDNGTINGVAATMPGYWGSHLGIVDLQLSVNDNGEWTVLEGRGAARPIAVRKGQELVALVGPDEQILDAIREDHEATLAYVRRGVGVISASIDSYFALVRDDPSVQIVTDAQKRYVEKLTAGTEYDGIPVLSASAPFKSGGRAGVDYYTDIDAGEIALKDVADLYVYPNTLRAVLLNGKGVRDWLEMSAGAFNTIDPQNSCEQALLNSAFASFNFDVIDGVTYQIDITQPPRFNADGDVINANSSRIVNLRFNGVEVRDEQSFIVATNNYRAGGGGGFPGMDGSSIIIEAPDTNRDALAAYLYESESLDPSADDNWSFAPIADDVTVTFESSPRAAHKLSPDSPIQLLSINENGFGRYQIRLDP